MTSQRLASQRLGSYRLERPLGRGGMGEVFLAWDDRLERHVAIKRILQDSPPDEHVRARFRQEARAAARLSHPSIVQVFELFETDGDDCLVMEYIEGRGLAEIIADGTPELEDTLRWTHDIADGLAEAHVSGLVHRDLKPENIRIATSGRAYAGRAYAGHACAGRAKILDFGLARLLWSDGLDRDSLEAAATRSGVLIGTVHAMSPEQASGRPVDHRSDLFALGGLLYAMLTGHLPFRGDNVLDTLRRVNSEQPAPLAELRPGLPLELIELVESLLAKAPEDRPQNARLVADQLERLRSGDSRKLTSAAVAEPKRPPAIPALDADDLPTGELQAPSAAQLEPVVRTLLLTGWVDSTRLIESLGDVHAAEVWARHDRIARDLLARHGGLEIDRADGFLLLFERPFAAVAYALAYHHALAELSTELNLNNRVELVARAGLHLGEVVLRHNPVDDVSRGAKPIEVEGLAKPIAARVVSLAGARQTLLTQSVFDLTRRAAVDDARWDQDLRWLAHGGYLFQGVEEPMEVYEVGVVDFAPLTAPTDSAKAKRVVSVSAEQMLGWRPARGQAIPRRPKWQLTERLGEGGFGEVWLAHHPSGEARVFKFCFESARLRALKREVTLFRLLKEALGHRDDIARVLDWNFDAPPYFLEAEHTEGGDLTQWAEQQGGLRNVPLPTRIELAAQVADALAAAHSVGVLHKDVKPENVLVTEGPRGGPRVRLTDFGIGALVDSTRLAEEGVTALGFSQTLSEDGSTAGSRRYIAPELLEGKPPSVPADLYSLGVLLYQLAVGDFARVLAPGWQRDVSDALLAEDIAALVDGSPERRPTSAGQVAEGLRSLEARRQARDAAERSARRRGTLRFAAIAGSILLMMASVLLFQAQRAKRQAEHLQGRAELAREQAEDLIGFMLGDLQQKLQAIGRLDALEGAGNQALEYFDDITARGEEHSPSALAAHAKALHQMGDVRMAQGDLDAASELFRAALRQTQELVARRPDDPQALFELGQSHFWVGNVDYRRGNWRPALAAMERYLELSQQLYETQPDHDDWLLEVAYGHNNVGAVYQNLANPALARQHYDQALDISQRLLERGPEQPKRQERWIKAVIRVGQALLAEGKLNAAYERFTAAAATAQSFYDRRPDDASAIRQLSTARSFVADLANSLGKTEDAERAAKAQHALMTRLVELEPDHEEWRRQLEVSRYILAQTLVYRGEREAAAELANRAIRYAELQQSAAEEPSRWIVRNLVHCLRLRADLERERGELETAYATIRRAEALIPGEGQRSWDRRVDVLLLLGQIAQRLGQPDAAEDAWQRALDEITSRPEAARNYIWLDYHARTLLLLERLEEARPVVYKLLGMEFQHPHFLAICRAKTGDLCR
ncbi:MAG: protein kinase [Acidobacteriota bacterium]